MTLYSYRISEEIARWTFEVAIREKYKDLGWWIAFANPTAGPWKTVTAISEDGLSSETVYRFGQKENRPDLIVVGDHSKRIIIVEAKDSMSKLIIPNQMKKSLQVIVDITAELQNIKNPIWGDRASYSVNPAFLWHSNNENSAKDDNELVIQSFSKFINTFESLSSTEPLNIAILKQSDGLVPLFYYKGVKYLRLEQVPL